MIWQNMRISRVAVSLAALVSCLPLVYAQDPEYAKLCASCHGENATGTERGPALVDSRSLRSLSAAQIEHIIKTGTQSGMPPFALPASQLQSLARWVHSLNASAHDVKPQ